MIRLLYLFFSMSMYVSKGNGKLLEPYLYIGFERCLLSDWADIFFPFPSIAVKSALVVSETP